MTGILPPELFQNISSHIGYCKWRHLKLTCKSVNNVLSQIDLSTQKFIQVCTLFGNNN